MIQKVINVVKDASGGIRPSLMLLPDDYGTTAGTYPVLLFLHGSGEAGSNLSNIYTASVAGGPAWFIEQNKFTNAFVNPADGNTYKYIIVSPQAPTGSTTAAELSFIIKDLLSKYRVDINRIYLTGLSQGAQGIEEYLTHYKNTPLYKAAGAVIMSAAIGVPSQTMVNAVIADGVNVWGFGATYGNIDTMGIMTRILCTGAFNGNGGNITGLGSLGRFTDYNTGHSSWNKFYDPTYTEVINGKPMNIYQWMLQYAQNAVVQQPPVVVQPPVDVPLQPAPKTIKSITITYSDNSQVTLP